MEFHSQDKLTDLIHRQLTQLPERPAPMDLIPQVLARIEQRQHRWWRRPWLTWPGAAKVISLPAMLLALAGCVSSFSALAELRVLDWALVQLAALFRPFGATFEIASTLGKALLLSLEHVQVPWMLAAAAVVTLMYLTCIAVGTMCFRVASAPGRRK